MIVSAAPLLQNSSEGKSQAGLATDIVKASDVKAAVIRKPKMATESHTQAEFQDLTRMQKLYLLLHYRFGHASLKRLKALTPYASILTKAHRVECPICMAAKATKRPHVGLLLRMSYALGLVIFDIQGPFRVNDVDGNRYVLLLVDDYTDKKWNYRLRTKDQLGATLRLCNMDGVFSGCLRNVPGMMALGSGNR